MSKASKHLKLLRRTQRDNIAERARELGCDRTTIPHETALERPVPGAKITESINDFFSRVHRKTPRFPDYNAQAEKYPAFCNKCSAKYLRRVRFHSCDCE